MPRAIRERKLDTASARLRLKPDSKPHKHAIDKELFLGYRRGLKGGTWVAIRYTGDKANPYDTKTFAIADDHSPADGVKVMTYFQAQSWVRQWAAAANAPTEAQGPLTVNQALDNYFNRLEMEFSKSITDARGRADLHIRPALGEIPVAALTRDVIAGWHFKLAAKGTKAKGTKDRGHKATANRVLNILKAALNHSFREGKTATDAAWRPIRPFRNVDMPRLRYFTQAELTRFCNAAQGTFRDLVKAGLYTGARYGELARLRAGDFNPDSGTIYIGEPKSGKGRHVVLTREGQEFFSILGAGKSANDLLLVQDDGRPWGRNHHIPATNRALAAARITDASFHILRHTAASQMVMAGVPLNVVAQNLGHADTRMTEKHYAHLSPSYVAETIRKFTPMYGLNTDSNVVSM